MLLIWHRIGTLDLVEVAPNSNPPVCRVMDYSKFKYQQSKRAQEAKKKQKIIHVKEVKFRPNTDQHDYDFKLKNALVFWELEIKSKFLFFFGVEKLCIEKMDKSFLRE